MVKVMVDPIEKFNLWWNISKSDSPLKLKSAICLSTIDRLGRPSARFVDLKKADHNGFVFCSYLTSNKGHEISNNPNVALTAWWDHCGLQIRITGIANLLSVSENDKYWLTRARKAKITTSLSQQSQPLNDEQILIDQFHILEKKFHNEKVPRPKNWGGYQVKPTSIEFLTFKENRLHLREFFQLKETVWSRCLLQP
ncbi:pyridoxine/pyridoxamine 5'-phosphate oxidase [Piscirickettsia salmonis]|uniref:pyridoxine/pyridoxamine 5'-phosphate oxidase n=1 Tax=Piscirickettsia salmonis TaxID=1238 RepID=UPI00214DF3EF|nr:pyridoxal 5'-phosphate synthase [Piscirickettsia salmonis]